MKPALHTTKVVGRIRVAGVRATGAGYPNAERTIRVLGDLGLAVAQDFGDTLPDGLHLWRLRDKGASEKLAILLRIGLLNARSLFRVLAARGDRNVPVYVPYPSIFFLWLLSWVPVARRPACVADAYISVWDSLFRDRGGAEGGFVARLIKSFEGRALRAADMVVVDTRANSEFMIAHFDLAVDRVRAWPLAIDEGCFGESHLPGSGSGRIRVLFVGTLIPLHGLPVLLDAIRTLQGDDRFEFRIIGDGQLGPLVEEFLLECPAAALTWKREWCPLEEVAQEIAAADICLGVFGGLGKAARVLPFKLYMYLASGKAVITQSKLSTPDGVPFPPVVMVDMDDERALANAILQLADDEALRARLGRDGLAYYREWLANAELVKRWVEALGKI